MAMILDGNGTVTGLAVGGLPDGTVHTGTLAQGTITDADVNDISASKLTGALPNIDGSALTGVGKVLQVVQGVTGNESSFAGTSGACGASVTITPTSASSKILVLVNVDGITVTNDNSGYGKFYVTRNSSNISFFGYPRNWTSVDNSSGTTMATTYLDSPSSTSALTYGTTWANLSGSVTLQINRDGASHSKSTITVMEIGN